MNGIFDEEFRIIRGIEFFCCNPYLRTLLRHLEPFLCFHYIPLEKLNESGLLMLVFEVLPLFLNPPSHL